MRNLRLMIAIIAACVIAGGIFVACQSYQFEQVTPKAIGAVKQGTPISGVPKPAKIMLVLDKSGSMKQHAEDDNWGCCQTVTGPNCSGYDPNGNCRWNIEKHLLVDQDGFLDKTKNNARYGLAIFPAKTAGTTGDACQAGQVLVDIGAGDNVQAVKDQLNQSDLQPLGGTPTAQMLQDVGSKQNFVLNTDAEKNTARYAILITDGMPNCNAGLDGSTCKCTSTNGDCTNPLNCLDDLKTVDAVKRLFQNGVTTFVIGFGLGSNPMATTALNNMASAGAGTTTTFFQADSQASLQGILDIIIAKLKPCVYQLAQKPTNDKLLEVSLTDNAPENGAFDGHCASMSGSECTLVRGTDWDFTDNTLLSVQLMNTPADGSAAEHAWCKALQNATPDRYTLNFVSISEMK